jgi:hypothetical protein
VAKDGDGVRGDMRNAYKFVKGKPDEKRSLQ